MTLPRLTLVIGGAASGKSTYAETLVVATGRPRVYIATAQSYDDEMEAKVSAHRAQRGPDWRTIEEPFDAASALRSAKATETALLDCATLWLSNHLLADHDIGAQSEYLLAALRECTAQVVVVSNEVGYGIVPENALSRQFRNAQGRLNRDIATQADLVVTVIAGLPLILKGAMPQ